MADLREEARIDALRKLNLLDTPASESFDRVTRMASKLFDLPIAAVSLTDSDRQWFKSRVGVDHVAIPRDKAPCARVAETCGLLVIPDLLADPYYCDSLLAKTGIRFYAGAPLTTVDGYGLGAMCVLGSEPRTATQVELASLHDLAAMVMAQIELQHAFGRIDPVTELPNRTQFLEDLADLARDSAPGQRRIVILIDLIAMNQMTHATRVLGPSVIDKLVKQAARGLRALIGPHRQAYHVGLTQLACLAPEGMDEAEYFALLDRNSGEIRTLGGHNAIGTPAIGVAPFVLGALQPEDVLRIAQGAAQDARAAGTFFQTYSTTQDSVHQRSFLLLREYEAAIQAPQDFHLVYQPRMDLASGRCVGVEALMRWTHPTLGPVSPGEFIPLIEQSSLARPTTAWVIETAAAQLAEWRKRGLDLMISVNISASNLREETFPEVVQQALARHGIPPDAFELEVTETAVMDDVKQALQHLDALALAGVRLAIDDFGTGYSSLSYLRRMPIHVVKIDQSFMKNLDTDDRQLAMVTAMVTLSKHLGHRVVAEGVETDDVLSRLRGTACDEVQGYFFARPMRADELVGWIERQKLH